MSSRLNLRSTHTFLGCLSLYSKPPEGDIAIEDFQNFAVDRLRVLRTIEAGRLARRHPDQLQATTCAIFNEVFSSYAGEEMQRVDVCSHFVLRLAFCQREELRRWLIMQERELFILRFNSLSDYDKVAFLRRNHLPYEEVTKQERRVLKQKLADVFNSFFAFDKAKAVLAEDYTVFFKVPFEKVTELVHSKKVYLQQGFAYVPRDEVVTLIVAECTENLTQDLLRLSHLWYSEIFPNEGDRLVPIIESLKSTYTGPDFAKPVSEGHISKGELMQLSKTQFPLCMKHLFDQLLQEHHLKHYGRQQLSLFLKGIGLPLDQALQFWQEAFQPRTPADKFEKEYAYNIRHNYGKEGKRADYTPFSCMKIISATPGVGEYHGCPFKTFPENQLHLALEEMGITPGPRQHIISKSKEKNYQVACCMAWETKNNKTLTSGITHPNQYFSGEETQK